MSQSLSRRAQQPRVERHRSRLMWIRSISSRMARRRLHENATTLPAVFTSDAKKAVHEDATTKVRLELVKHEGGQIAASRLQIGQECRPGLLYRSVQQGSLGTMALVRARGRVGVTTCCWLRGKHPWELSASGRKQLPVKPTFLAMPPLRRGKLRSPECPHDHNLSATAAAVVV